MIREIVLIAIGAYLLIVNGILGTSYGRSKIYSEKMGKGTMRIIYTVIGAALIGYGIYLLVG